MSLLILALIYTLDLLINSLNLKLIMP